MNQPHTSLPPSSQLLRDSLAPRSPGSERGASESRSKTDGRSRQLRRNQPRAYLVSFRLRTLPLSLSGIFLGSLLARADGLGVGLQDVLATATRFTAEAIAVGLDRFAPAPPERLVVGGGGSWNRTLLDHLRDCLPGCRVVTNEDLGFNSDAKEVVAFAILANEAVFASCNNAPSATGARNPVVMGKLSI